jgi:hypothetical protein
MSAKLLADEYRANSVKACRAALRATRNEPWKTRLEKINELLGGHGTEAIRGEWQNGYWCDIAAAYVNMGDTYNMTVVHVRGDGWNPAGRFVVATWGDWFEKNERKMNLV